MVVVKGKEVLVAEMFWVQIFHVVVWDVETDTVIYLFTLIKSGRF